MSRSEIDFSHLAARRCRALKDRDVQIAGQGPCGAMGAVRRFTGDDEQIAARLVGDARHGIGRREVHQGCEGGDLGEASFGIGGPAPAFKRKRVVPGIFTGGAAHPDRGFRRF